MFKRMCSFVLAMSLAFAFSACKGETKEAEKENEAVANKAESNEEVNEVITGMIVPYYDEDSELYGYCSLEGKIAIKPRFQEAGIFEENGLACVRQEGMCGFIDRNGDFVIEPQFTSVSSVNKKDEKFRNGFAEVEVGDWEWEPDVVRVASDVCGLINEKGEYIIEPEHSVDYSGEFLKNGITYIRIDDKYVLMNTEGQIVKELPYLEIWEFAENGLAVIKTGDPDDYETWKYGYINEDGEIIIEPQFDDARTFGEDGIAVVYINHEHGNDVKYINEKGEFLPENVYEKAEAKLEFAENGLAVIEKDGKYGYVNKAGEIVIEPKFDGAGKFAKCGVAKVWTDTRVYSEALDGYSSGSVEFGFIDESGEYIFTPQFEEANAFDEYGMAKVKKYDKWGYINAEGQYVTPLQYDYVASFSPEGIARVESDGKSGFIDRAGNYIAELQFEYVYDFSSDFSPEGLARVGVKVGDRTVEYYLNTEGKIIKPGM